MGSFMRGLVLLGFTGSLYGRRVLHLTSATAPTGNDSSWAGAALEAATLQYKAYVSLPKRTKLHAEYERSGSCELRPLGKGPVASPDSVEEFLLSHQLSTSANNAQTPANYTLAFKNLHASTSASGFLGYLSMTSYNTTECARRCDATEGCIGINTFFERDPSIDIGPECPNPPSTTNIKCVFWSTRLNETTAHNAGYTDKEFTIAIAGSNGYNKNIISSATDGYVLQAQRDENKPLI